MTAEWPLLTGSSPPTRKYDGLFLPGEPRSFDAFSGQPLVVRTLRTAVSAARKSGRRLPHILLADRRPGVGKTLLAKITSVEMGTDVHMTMGDLTAHEAVRIMQDMSDRDVLFWDEIHSSKTLDWLLPFMQSSMIVLPTGAVIVPNVSLIAATTKPEAIDEAIMSRFLLRPMFRPYEFAEMERMLSDGINDAELRRVIVTASGGNPRELRRVERIAEDLVTIDEATVANVLAQAGYGTSGLPLGVETYLHTLWRSPSFTASHSTLEALVGPEIGLAETVALDRGLVSVTGRGRRLTRSGIDVATRLAGE